MKDEERKRKARKLRTEPLGGANQLGDDPEWLNFLLEASVGFHRPHYDGIAGEVFGLELQHPGMRRDVGKAFCGGQGELWRHNLKCKALANQCCQLLLVLKRIDAGDDTPDTVSEQKDRKPGLARFHQCDERIDIGDVIIDVLAVETLAIRLPVSVEINSIDSDATGDQLAGRPQVVTAVRVDAGTDSYDSARFILGSPRTDEDLETPCSADSLAIQSDRFLLHDPSGSWENRKDPSPGFALAAS